MVANSKLRYHGLSASCRLVSLWWLTVVFVGYRTVTYVFRFFTLAHEIAHNLIEPHNSEHEFYFSAICEAHMLALSRLMGAAEV